MSKKKNQPKPEKTLTNPKVKEPTLDEMNLPKPKVPEEILEKQTPKTESISPPIPPSKEPEKPNPSETKPQTIPKVKKETTTTKTGSSIPSETTTKTEPPPKEAFSWQNSDADVKPLKISESEEDDKPKKKGRPKAKHFEINKAFVAMAVSVPYDYLASVRGEHWRLSDQEHKMLTESTLPIVNKYLPKYFKKYPEEAMLVFAAVMVTAPKVLAEIQQMRVKKQAKQGEKESDERATKTESS
tara:strand:+ start:1918 stop:2643 length:726 start_codon:yes stop_codon:yes gene_type:complete